MSSLFLIFLLCLSMHACEARYIGLGHKGFGASLQQSGKGVLLVVEKFRLGMDSTEGSVKKEDGAAENGHGAIIQDSMTRATKGLKFTSRAQKSGVPPVNKPLVSVSWPVPCKINRDKNHGDKTTSPGIYSDYSRPRTRMEKAGGDQIVESSGHHVGLLKATSTTTTNKEEARRRRSVLLSVNKEAVDSKNNDKVENNVVFTDYNPPHQTPPIHNKRT
ncbi:hypothetical protein GBA52_006377 [Prunus armeniaca]|nr:hypothetical protein GBA52_006377 [Prunus armeniaca]